jgi:hypothetical protein
MRKGKIRSESGSVLVTNGSGSGRPKNIWIRNTVTYIVMEFYILGPRPMFCLSFLFEFGSTSMWVGTQVNLDPKHLGLIIRDFRLYLSRIFKTFLIAVRS